MTFDLGAVLLWALAIYAAIVWLAGTVLYALYVWEKREDPFDRELRQLLSREAHRG